MTGATLAALVCVQAALLPAGERVAAARRWIALGLVACIAAHVLLALLTLEVVVASCPTGRSTSLS